MRWTLSRRALTDLDSIWDYTAERWDQAQAERYLRLLQRGVEALAADPLIGRTCDDIRSGYRKLNVGSHVIFYKTNSDAIHVIRILHARMDFGRHF